MRKCKKCGALFYAQEKYSQVCEVCKTHKPGSGIGRISYLGLFIKQLDKNGKKN
jgi:hypothetical protein